MPPVAIIIASVVACLIALLLLILSIRIRIQIKTFNTDLSVMLRILFFKYTIYPDDKPKKEKKKSKKRRAEKAQEDEEEKTTAKSKKKKRNILQMIRLILYILKRLYKRFPKHFMLRIKRFIIVVGGKDAAQTALYYGTVRAAVSYLLTACETLFPAKTPHNATLLIEPNYLTDESLCEIDMDLSISIFSGIKLLWHTYPLYRDGKHAVQSKKKKSNASVRDAENTNL